MEKTRVAFVGCGGISRSHISNLVNFDDVEFVGFYDIRRKHASEKREMAGGGKVYRSYVGMLDEAKPDALYICVPPDQHGKIEYEAIERGINFLVQKPMALRMKLALEIRDRAQAAGVITAVGFQDRYLDLIGRVKEFLTDRTVAMVDGAWVGGIPGPDWWPKYKTSGGQIVEQNIHHFDLLRYLFGEPEKVYCSGGRGIVDRENYDIHDYSTAVITMKNGIVATLYTGCYTENHPGFRNGLNIHCTDAEVEYRLRNHVVFTEKGCVQRYDRVDPQPMTIDRAFIDAVRAKDQSLVRSPYADACKTLELTLACNKSIRTGKEIRL